jgi:hypothetical protein
MLKFEGGCGLCATCCVLKDRLQAAGTRLQAFRVEGFVIVRTFSIKVSIKAYSVKLTSSSLKINLTAQRIPHSAQRTAHSTQSLTPLHWY